MRSRRAEAAALASALLAAAAGCGAGGGGGGGMGQRDAALPPDGPDLGFCEPYAAKACERLAGCSPAYVERLWGDRPTCEARFRLWCRIQAEAAGSGRDRAGADRCPSLIEGASCDDLLAGEIPGCLPPGTRALAAPCALAAQCQSGFCQLPETAFCGQCAARAPEGAECELTEGCQAALVCTAVGRCARPAGEGAFCNESSPCRWGVLHCSAADNTCRRFRAEGQSCNVAGPTPREPCDWGLVCRPIRGGSCQRSPPLAGPGEPCGRAMDRDGPWVFCRGSASCLAGVCTPAGADGEPCTPAPMGDASGCSWPAVCLRGICKLPDPASCG